MGRRGKESLIIDQVTKTILIIGSDKLAAQALTLEETKASGVTVFLDRSSSLGRVIKLVRQRRIRFGLISKMFLAEMTRSRPKNQFQIDGQIRSNKDLLEALSKYAPKQVVLFRAGLIINKAVIDIGIPLLNIHCAKVPDYGGLGSIDRALSDGVYRQEATLHQVTVSIDEGEIYDTEPFELRPNLGYTDNENLAYRAGLVLLRRTLKTLA